VRGRSRGSRGWARANTKDGERNCEKQKIQPLPIKYGMGLKSPITSSEGVRAGALEEELWPSDRIDGKEENHHRKKGEQDQSPTSSVARRELEGKQVGHPCSEG